MRPDPPMLSGREGRAGRRRRRPNASERGEHLRVLVGVAGLTEAVDDAPPHDALLVDDERRAQRGAALLEEDAVLLRSRAVRPEVGQQAEGVALLVGEDL